MRELVGVAIGLLAACGGGTKQAATTPENSAAADCTSTAAVIARVLASEDAKAEQPTVSANVAKRCTDDKWSAEARTCLSSATAPDAVKACGYKNLTHEQEDKLGEATAPLTSVTFERAFKAMLGFKADLCACKDAACVEKVSDAMTKWSQEMSKKNEEPPRMTEAQQKQAAAIGEEMAQCMQTAMGASMPPPQPLTVTGIDPVRGDTAGGTYVKIAGANFIADGARNVKVYFGSKQGTVVRFASDSELIVEAPGGKAGEVVDVLLIFEPGGEKKLVQAFTYEKPKKKKK
jgi:hypothetical protein